MLSNRASSRVDNQLCQGRPIPRPQSSSVKKMKRFLSQKNTFVEKQNRNIESLAWKKHSNQELTKVSTASNPGIFSYTSLKECATTFRNDSKKNFNLFKAHKDSSGIVSVRMAPQTSYSQKRKTRHLKLEWKKLHISTQFENQKILEKMTLYETVSKCS